MASRSSSKHRGKSLSPPPPPPPNLHAQVGTARAARCSRFDRFVDSHDNGSHAADLMWSHGLWEVHVWHPAVEQNKK